MVGDGWDRWEDDLSAKTLGHEPQLGIAFTVLAAVSALRLESAVSFEEQTGDDRSAYDVSLDTGAWLVLAVGVLAVVAFVLSLVQERRLRR